ncbi:nicotinamide N-methyltransferase [Malassezia vespertilionis]|uniref:Nnt1p n=1 Tax=Malassezia vespertilionis TaxID=2020962 RepID=A0A2N1JC54_9BASI|nr:nicotinamide N-methyltransferase [Malassezia vespertilionis]PKI84141.1 Nnt1p [Malassezia vespertilionis]WFD06739.1 nicotinamide N-methyltransferase [Malassezia vespertilionis]
MEAEAAWSLFEEPADFRPASPPPTEIEQVLVDGTHVKLQLVGSHPLWGHYLWNAAPTMANYMLERADTFVYNRTILELGAAAGLPSIACGKHGARTVIATDYPDPDLMNNLHANIDANACSATRAEGYIWGADPCALLQHTPEQYDTILMSDLIFNHQAHAALLTTCDQCLTTDAARRPQILVFFSHHRPSLAEKDMQFFALATERGYACQKIGQWLLEVCESVLPYNLQAHVSE